MAEQRYETVMSVMSDGLAIWQVAEKVGVSRQTLHSWLARFEGPGEGGHDRSNSARPALSEVETLGTRRSDGVVAADHSAG